MRLIDADELLKELEDWSADLQADNLPARARQLGITDAIVIACQMPTVEAVKHGKWIPREEGVVYPFWARYTCSECGTHWDDTLYCPNCGARMDGES